MRDALRVFWEAVKVWWDELFLLMLMNVVTVLLAFPVVTLPPALAGLWAVANRVADGRAIGWRDYFAGFRRYFWRAWQLTLVNLLAGVVVVSDLRFYTPGGAPFEISPTTGAWLRGIVIGLGGMWAVAQMYPLALLMEQEDRRLYTTLRNTAVLVIAHPGFTAVQGMLLAVVIAAGVVMPLLTVLFVPSLVAVVCNASVLYLLESHRNQGETRR